MMACDLVIIASLFFISDEPTVGLKLAAVLYGYLIIGLFGYTVDMMLSGANGLYNFYFQCKIPRNSRQNFQRTATRCNCCDIARLVHQNEQNVLLIIVRRTEVNAVTKIVKEVDKNAFLSKASVSGVYGAGFEVLRT